MATDERFRCRVCGALESEPPYGENGDCPTFNFCPCCDVEYGYQDCNPIAAARYRAAWLEKGGAWKRRYARLKLEDLALEEQLKRIPVAYRDHQGSGWAE